MTNSKPTAADIYRSMTFDQRVAYAALSGTVQGEWLRVGRIADRGRFLRASARRACRELAKAGHIQVKHDGRYKVYRVVK